MKALSIRQPWAWLIVNGYKPIENRDWSTGFRGELLIHAGKTFDADALDAIAHCFPQVRSAMPLSFDMGGIVGVAMLVDVVTTSSSRWFNGPFGLVMRSARPLPLHPLRGALGLFQVDDQLASELLAGAAQASPAEAERAGQQRLIG